MLKCFITQEILASDKVGPFVIYEENEELKIQPLYRKALYVRI